MAFSAKFVSVTGSGLGDGSSEANAWTLAEALTDAAAGDMVNVISGSYSSGADTVSNAGTISQLIVFRGYTSSPGDLENQGWNADGTLDTTDFPVITMSATLTIGTGSQYTLFQNLHFTGAVGQRMLGGPNGDYTFFVECKVLNTANNSSAKAIEADDNCSFINCDIECSGADHGTILLTGRHTAVVGCRITGLAEGRVWFQADGTAVVINTLLEGKGASPFGTGLKVLDGGEMMCYVGVTFYNLARCVELPNSAGTDVPVLVNNHATNSAEYINSLYSATASHAFIEVNNRTRDNITPRTGVGDGANVGEVETDTGGPETDYTNAGASNFTLIDGAPGVETGMRQHTDIGAYQRAGGGGGAISIEVHNTAVFDAMQIVSY